MNDLRVGVVGMGIGQLHLLSWLSVRGATVTAIVESDPDRRSQAAADWQLTAHADLDALLADGVDIVDLCTPPAAHEDAILQCLDAGVHVICEKPLVDSLAACDRLAAAAVQAAERSGARLMPILQYRFGPGIDQCIALREAGLTGRLFTASASTWWRRDRDYYDGAPWRATWHGALGGTVVNHAVHIHDLLTFVGGPIAEIRAMATTRVNAVETEDCAVAIGRTTDGALVTMNVSTGAVVESSRLVWCFEHVQIESSTEPYHPARGPWRFEFRDPSTAARAAEVLAAIPDRPQEYIGQFQAFVDALETDGARRESPVTLDDARAALELVTAWYHSARSGETVALPITTEHPAYESWLPPTVA